MLNLPSNRSWPVSDLRNATYGEATTRKPLSITAAPSNDRRACLPPTNARHTSAVAKNGGYANASGLERYASPNKTPVHRQYFQCRVASERRPAHTASVKKGRYIPSLYVDPPSSTSTGWSV